MKQSDISATKSFRQALGVGKPQPKPSNTHAYVAQKQSVRQSAQPRRKR